MIRKLTINDFEIVESIVAKLHKLHVYNRPDFYIENERPINKKEYKAMLKYLAYDTLLPAHQNTPI